MSGFTCLGYLIVSKTWPNLSFAHRIVVVRDLLTYVYVWGLTEGCAGAAGAHQVDMGEHGE